MTGQAYRVKGAMFGSLANGGHLQTYILVDHPGVTVENVKETRNHQWERHIYYKGQEYKTLDEAVTAHERDLLV
jgi:hypothetical protein